MSPSTNPDFQDAIEQLRNGDLGRRDFLRRIVVLGGSSSVAFGLLNQMEASAQVPSGNTGQIPGGSYVPNQQTPHGHDFGQHTSPLPGSTTGSYGEEGNPQYSTMRYGEENTVTPSTSSYGEEQGPPTATSYAVGEETTTPPVTSYTNGEEGTTQPPSSLAYGEEGQPTSTAYGEEGMVKPTSNAYGEEGQPVTTYAVGEEQPTNPNCYRPPTTTQAWGEENTSPPATTQAWGEETQTLPQPPPTYKPPTSTLAHGEENTGVPNPSPTPSTRAVGEEGSVSPSGPSQPVRSVIESGIQKVVPNVWKSFRRW